MTAKAKKYEAEPRKGKIKRTEMDTLKRAQIEALEKSLGVVTTACRTSGVARSTHYKWMQEDAEYAAACNELENIALDFAESQLHKQIKDGNPTATIFFLKTKGKKRGYIERVDVTTDGKEMAAPVIVVKQIKSDEL